MYYRKPQVELYEVDPRGVLLSLLVSCHPNLIPCSLLQGTISQFALP